ncbi:MAG TPA: hypothetical protein VNA26_07790 [Chitinophagaceae bacterium]|nr:hypothetical protein [Chitinophagaceae bacterium]
MSEPTVYLDTCIISGLAKADLSIDDLEALHDLLEKHKNGKIHPLTSQVTKEELEKIPPTFRTQHKIVYNLLKDVPTAQTYQTDSGLMLMGVGGGIREDPVFTALKNLLPGEDDARHIFQATKNGVSKFVTTDYKY